MTAPDNFRVMGPGGNSLVHSDTPNFNSAPKFISNETSKKRYRDTLRRWVRILANVANSDKKYKGILSAAGNLIYWACDVHAQDMLQKAELAGELNLDGSEDDEDRTNLVESIINIIAKESPTDKLRQEVELLTAIHNCERESKESPAEYVVRFNSALARYANQSGSIDQRASRQFATLMIKNAKLSPDTLNSVMFQLSTQSSIDNISNKCTTVSISSKNMEILIKYVRTAEEDDVDVGKVMKKAKELCPNQLSTEEFSLTTEQTAEAISQLKVETKAENLIVQQSSMIGSMNIREKRPGGRPCFVCGKEGHFWREEPSCRERMKMARKETMKRVREKDYKEEEPERKQVKKNSFFRQEG